MTHWALSLQGRPYKLGADGPSYFDCWGLVRYVQKKYFGRIIQKIDTSSFSRADILAYFKKAAEYENWVALKEHEIAKEGDCVLMSSTREPIHIGVVVIYQGITYVLHCTENEGVCVHTFSEIASQVLRVRRIYTCKK